MLRILRLLFTGWWTPPPRVRDLGRRCDALEEELAYVKKSVSRLRGHLTGGLRNGDGDLDDDEEDDDAQLRFPEDAFQRAIEERRRYGTGSAQD